MRYRDVSPDRQDHRQVDRDRVAYLAKVRVEQHEDAPAIGVHVSARSIIQMHVNRVRDVFDHHEEIGYGEACEDYVSRWTHLGSRQHGDVEDISDWAEYAHQQTGPTVYLAVLRNNVFPCIRTTVLRGRQRLGREVQVGIQAGIHPGW